MARSLSREFLLAAACSVWPPSDSRAEAILAAAAGVLDWDGGALGAPPPRPAALPESFSDALTRFTDGHAGQERHDALARGDRAEGDDR